MATTTTKTPYQIPRPSVPGVLSDNLRQNVSVYKAMRTVVDVVNQQQLQPTTPPDGSISFGSVATTASDGSPATFKQGQIDCSIVRVAPAGSSLGIENVWASGGGNTTITHHLGRQPIGWICTHNTFGAILTDISWDATHVVMQTTHSNADTYLMFF
jgi:hypothetical protein